MEIVKSARNLAEYIKALDKFNIQPFNVTQECTHLGALYVDIILQAGLNYSSVVKPRVDRILLEFPQAYNLKNLIDTIERQTIEKFIGWNHHIKLNRFINLIEFSIENNINDCEDLKLFLKSRENQIKFVEVKGVGPKTLDYAMKLLNFDTIAVDRHIISFIKLAGIEPINYEYTKRTVEFAADFLNVSRASLDTTIWLYMSSKNKPYKQLSLEFIA